MNLLPTQVWELPLNPREWFRTTTYLPWYHFREYPVMALQKLFLEFIFLESQNISGWKGPRKVISPACWGLSEWQQNHLVFEPLLSGLHHYKLADYVNITSLANPNKSRAFIVTLYAWHCSYEYNSLSFFKFSCQLHLIRHELLVSNFQVCRAPLCLLTFIFQPFFQFWPWLLQHLVMTLTY